MSDVDIQAELNDFEAKMIGGSEVASVRAALRTLLFKFTNAPVDGSLSDAVKMIAEKPRSPAGSAAVIVRAIANPDLIRDNGNNQIARNVVTLVERELPGLCSFLGLKAGSQTYERFELLCGAKAWVDGQLAPLRRSASTLQTLLATRKTVQSSLAHGRLTEFGAIYRMPEIKDAIEAIFLSLEQVARVGPTLAADVEVCERIIADARGLAMKYPSFITIGYLDPWLESASARLQDFIESLRGRFTSIIEQDWSGANLLKRYPLAERGRELRILVPFGNEGRGVATDVRVKVSSDSQDVLFANETIALGSVSPGKFSVALDVHIIQSCASFRAMLEVEWGEVGTSERQCDLFEFCVFAQSSEINWDAYTYADPYGTSPAEGTEFVGRQEQIQVIVARMLRRPMEPSYITGQKRVGKTSLATAAAEQAQSLDPKGKLSWNYILWGQIAHEDPRVSLRQLGEQIEEFIAAQFPKNVNLPTGSYDGSLSPLIKLSAAAKVLDPDRRFVVIIDEFDEMPQELYLQGNLADTVFGNIRALTTTGNLSLLLVGGENMPFVMDRQGQRLNKFSRVNLTYFDRSTEWDDYTRLIRKPSSGFLEWHDDAVAEVYDLTNGNPYFTKIICSKVFARALRERDVDVTKEEIRAAVDAEISRFDDNLFAHLWQDGIFAPIEEREPIILKRKRVLTAFARCARTGLAITVGNMFANARTSELTETDLKTILADFVSRQVLFENEGIYRAVLPIFQLWLVDIGLTRLAADSLSQNLADEAQRVEDAAQVLSEELVALTRKWPTYRGRHIGAEEVRAWLNQRPSSQDQRVLFTILRATRFLSEPDILERIRNARKVVFDIADVAVRRKAADRRNDIVVTYVDGEGKSGQKYTATFAEENVISTTAILSPSSFQDAYKRYKEKHGAPKVIVIIDDFVGTGLSLSQNVKKFHDENLSIFTNDSPKVLVFSLFATQAGQQAVLTALSELEYPRFNFRAGEILDQSAFTFNGEKSIFSNTDERDRALALAQDIGASIYRNAPLGFGDQALNVVLPTTVPNNCLPLLHSHGKGRAPQWRPLFERLVN